MIKIEQLKTMPILRGRPVSHPHGSADIQGMQLLRTAHRRSGVAQEKKERGKIMAYVLPPGQKELNVIIGNRIQAAMHRAGLTHEALAAAVGSERVSITNYCAGIRQCPTVLLCKIARFLSVSTDYLLDVKHSGIADPPSVEAICEYTGLSAEAVKMLHEKSRRNQMVLIIAEEKKKGEK